MYLDQVDELEAYLKINSKMRNLIISMLLLMISNCEGTNNIIRKWRRNQLFEPEITSGKVSLLGVDSLWGDCTFIPADWDS